MTKKRIRILIITFIVVLLIVFLVFLLTNNGEEILNKQDNSEDPIKEDIIIVEEPEIKDSEIEEPEIEEPVNALELEIKNIARNFAERYGTWSNHNKGDNFKSAKIYATSRMKNVINDFILDNEKLADDYEDYYGIVSRSLNVKIIDLENSKANLNVSIQSTETFGKDSNTKTNYKNLNLKLINSGNTWLVDDAQWE